MTLSLRGRLLIGVMSLVIVGLLIANGATYLTLQNSLLSRIDQELVAGSTVFTAVNVLRSPDCRFGGPGSSTTFPANTVTELIGPDGTVLAVCRAQAFGATSSTAGPVLPKSLPKTAEGTPTQPVTVEGTGGVDRYRVTHWSENSFPGDVVVFAVPLTETQFTLSQVLLLELAISAAVVVATGILAFLIIRISLRPLERIGAVAADIAAGDLARRVEPATQHTEIGRLGLALNGMLSQIETAFAERAASNDRLRRVIADASHELRTPLTSIRGYAEMLRRGAAESPTDSESARRRIEEESIRMTGLVDDLLVLARLDQGRPLDKAAVDLRTIANDAVADARVVAPQREISISANGPVIVTGDDTRLRQVMSNLMRNALVHTPQQTPIEVAVATDEGLGRMSVADHGPGLAEGDEGRIFEPFYRADPSRSRDSGGAGLGLSIVSAVVAAHGGHVKVTKTEGGGATFEVELPLAVE
jgi:two-component system, OmpR family, sensor kinase